MDWQSILLVIFSILLLVLGGYAQTLRKSIKAFLTAFDAAIEDGKLTQAEWEEIAKEGENVVRDIKLLTAAILSALHFKIGVPRTNQSIQRSAAKLKAR